MNAHIDAVLSYHMNPQTCGVAKFNQRLAKALGVPCYAFETEEALAAKHPLISIKPQEMPRGVILCRPDQPFDLFLHGPSDAPWLPFAHRVYVGNSALAREMRPLRPDVIEAWCPSTIEGNPHRGTINVLTFGMAHKLQTTCYAQLKALLDATGEDYTVSVSTAVHEGSPWDETAAVSERLRAVFESRLRVLGYLADDAMARELRECTAVALFFEPALRANNTTFWAAYDANVPIITNLDGDSPAVRGTGVYGIEALETWPPGDRVWPVWRDRVWPGWPVWRRDSVHTWACLVGKMQGSVCAK